MKVNTANLQVYNIGKPVAQIPNQPNRQPVIDRLRDARFADLLSTEEKKFITENFKSEVADSSDLKLGRFLDVRA